MANTGERFTEPKTKISGTARYWASRLKMTPHGFRVRARALGKGNPKTYSRDDLRRHRGPCKTRDTSIYESPCGRYKGTPGEISKSLGIKRAVFLRRVREYGANNPKTYRTKEEALLIRGLNIQATKTSRPIGNDEWAALSDK